MYQVQSQTIVAAESEEKVKEESDMVKQVSEEVKRLFFKMKCDQYLQNKLKGGHLKVMFHCLRNMNECVTSTFLWLSVLILHITSVLLHPILVSPGYIAIGKPCNCALHPRLALLF